MCVCECVCVCTRARARALVFGEIESFAGWGSNTGKVSPAEDCRELARLSGSRRPAGERDWDPARDPREWRPWGQGDASPLAVDTWSVVSRRRLEGHASFQALRPALLQPGVERWQGSRCCRGLETLPRPHPYSDHGWPGQPAEYWSVCLSFCPETLRSAVVGEGGKGGACKALCEF